jgi:hypothetical protein
MQSVLLHCCTIMLTAIMLSVIMLRVMAPFIFMDLVSTIVIYFLKSMKPEMEFTKLLKINLKTSDP